MNADILIQTRAALLDALDALAAHRDSLIVIGAQAVYLRTLFTAGPDAPGAMRAGRAEEGIGEPATVSFQTSILAADLINAL